MPQRRPTVGLEASPSPHSRHFQGGPPPEPRQNPGWTSGLVKGMPRLGEGSSDGEDERRNADRGEPLAGIEPPELPHHPSHAVGDRHRRDQQHGPTLEAARAELVVYGFTFVLTSPSA